MIRIGWVRLVHTAVNDANVRIFGGLEGGGWVVCLVRKLQALKIAVAQISTIAQGVLGILCPVDVRKLVVKVAAHMLDGISIRVE